MQATGPGRKNLSQAMPQGVERFCQTRLRCSTAAAAAYTLVSAALLWGEPNKISLMMGGVSSLLGVALRILTAGYGYKVGELTVRGPYRFVRHPYYLGTMLLYLGICIASRSAYVVGAGMTLLGIAYRRQLVLDEHRWRERLGPAVVEFFAGVSAIVPQLLPAPAFGEKRRFSMALALLAGRHRELDAVLLVLLVYGVFYLSTLSLLATGIGGDLFRSAIVITTVGYAILRIAHYGAIPYVRTSLHSRSRFS